MVSAVFEDMSYCINDGKPGNGSRDETTCVVGYRQYGMDKMYRNANQLGSCWVVVCRCVPRLAQSVSVTSVTSVKQ